MDKKNKGWQTASSLRYDQSWLRMRFKSYWNMS